MPLNMEKYKIYQKEYREMNKEKAKEYQKKYRINNYKTIAIKRWQRIGILDEDYDKLYDKFLNTLNCEECDTEFNNNKKGGKLKVLDHDHETGKIRNILCSICNIKRR